MNDLERRELRQDMAQLLRAAAVHAAARRQMPGATKADFAAFADGFEVAVRNVNEEENARAVHQQRRQSRPKTPSA